MACYCEFRSAYRALQVATVLTGVMALLAGGPRRAGQAFEPISLPGPPVTYGAAGPDDEAEENPYSGGASLKTEPDLEHRLEKARIFAAEGTYNHASTLWQAVLNESGDTLITRDGRTYVSLAEDVERTIAKLPAAGLRIYRITADGEARAILADGVGQREEQALSEVVRKYFVSSLGDDAAFKLGCMALDHYDFVGASRLFLKILEDHPDPSMPLAEVWMRLAVATAQLGDVDSARDALANAQKSSGDKPHAEVFQMVGKYVDQAGSGSTAVASSSADWTMAMGNSARRGQMPSLSEAATSATLTRMWGYSFPLDFTVQTTPQDNVIHLHARYGNARQLVTSSSDEKSLINKWRTQGWRPGSQLLIAGGRVYFKTSTDLTCWDATGESDLPLWRTLWANKFEIDPMTRVMAQLAQNYGLAQDLPNRPISSVEVMLFGDRIHQSMSISQGMIFNIEGKHYAKQLNAPPAPAAQNSHSMYGVVPRRTRQNWLAAYDLRTGKVRWHRGAAEPSGAAGEADAGVEVGFMAAPVPYGNLLLTPVSDSGTLWLYALAGETGKTVWRSYLCDEPTGGTKPWSTVGVSVDGRDAYVVCGAGVVLAVDATTGTIRYAVRYARDGTKDTAAAQRLGYQIPTLLELNGWDDDIAIPYRNLLVVMASDSDKLFAVDRRTGKQLWESPRTPLDHTASYCIGVTPDGGFLAGGKNCIRRYDIPSGKLMWEQITEDSFGRAMLTEDAVFVPVKNSILRLDAKSGQPRSQAMVSLTSNDPVGNLYSDGEKVWVVGANKFYALTNLQQRMALLESRIRNGDASARLERMNLLAKDGNIDDAVKDLLSAYEIILDADGLERAAPTLFDAFDAIQLDERRPDLVLGIMHNKFIETPTALSLSDDLTARRADIVFSSLRTIQQNQIPGVAQAVLDVLPLVDQPYHISMARQALSATATEDDVDRLRAVVQSGDPTSRKVSIDAFARLAKDAAVQPLRDLLKAEDPSTQLAAARALANAGERSAMQSLLELMNSQNTEIRASSAAAMRYLTGQQFGFTAYDDQQKRSLALKSWQDWLAKNGASAELTIPIPDSEPMLGRTLIGYRSRNLVVEYDEKGEERWQTRVNYPWSVQGLPNGHRLISSYTQREVIEYDAAGKEVWRKTGLPGNPYSARRLLNGNTLVTCSNVNRVIEYKRDGSIAWETTRPNRPSDARRLVNGNTLVTLYGSAQVIEIDPKGTVVWDVKNMTNAFSAQRLDTGNTLITMMNGRVVEVNQAGTIVWQKAGLSQPYDAQRLPNGNTIIADNIRVQELDPKGNVVWQRGENGASAVSRF